MFIYHPATCYHPGDQHPRVEKKEKLTFRIQPANQQNRNNSDCVN